MPERAAIVRAPDAISTDPYDALRLKTMYPLMGTFGPWRPAVLWMFLQFTTMLSYAEIVFFLFNLAILPLVATLILQLCGLKTGIAASVTLAVPAIGLVAVRRGPRRDRHNGDYRSPVDAVLSLITVLTCTYHHIYDSPIVAPPNWLSTFCTIQRLGVHDGTMAAALLPCAALALA